LSTNKNKFTNNDNYGYLLNLSIKDMSKDSYQKLINKITQIEKQIDVLNNTNANEMWNNDLILLQKKLNY
jgi:hypothetical protein